MAEKRLRFFGVCVALLLSAASACLVKTGIVAEAFNAGAIDSPSDPTKSPDERRRDIVVRLIREELMDAYFGQGDACVRTEPWLEKTRNVCVALEEAAPLPYVTDPQHPERDLAEDPFYRYVRCFAYARNVDGCGILRDLEARQLAGEDPPPPPQAQESMAAQSALQELGLPPSELETKARVITDLWLAPPSQEPVCASGSPGVAEVGPFLDRVRFDLAIARAAHAVGSALRQGLVDDNAVWFGKQHAFEQAAAYLANRKWRRQLDRRTTALVVKGGAATGIYSAGVVWTALNLIQGCEDDPGSCGLSKKRDNRFNILSGTSTGAMIATGVDRFNAARTRAERRAGIDNIAKWFTCYSLNDLYCVESAPITKLAKHQRGVLRFDGICQMLNSCVDQGMLDNESELVLNTTDFRSGRLFHLSDQGELSSKVDVIHAALASAELPSIVVPEPALKVDVGDQPRQRGAFLDGGVRSEVPLMAAVLRGAERALVVSSSPWLLGDTRPLPSALSIAQRYIDVSTGGVAETDIAGALRRVESVRFAEFQACLQAVTHFGLGCGRGGCDALRLCEARFEQVCSHEAVHQNAEPHVDERHLSVRVRDRIHALWQSEMIFRNAGEVDAAHGYSFDPEDLRRLFRAGAEAGRQRCIHIAMLLGIVDPSSEPSQSLRDGLMGHCNQRLADDLCGRGGRASGEDVAIRDCSEASTIDLGVCGGMPTADAWMCAPQWHLDSRAGGGQ